MTSFAHDTRLHFCDHLIFEKRTWVTQKSSIRCSGWSQFWCCQLGRGGRTVFSDNAFYSNDLILNPACYQFFCEVLPNDKNKWKRGRGWPLFFKCYELPWPNPRGIAQWINSRLPHRVQVKTRTQPKCLGTLPCALSLSQCLSLCAPEWILITREIKREDPW